MNKELKLLLIMFIPALLVTYFVYFLVWFILSYEADNTIILDYSQVTYELETLKQ